METPVIDIDHIGRLGGAGDPCIREILDDFVDSLPDIAAKLESARHAGDLVAYREEAHRLKGAAAMTGFPRLAALARDAEDAAAQGAEPPDAKRIRNEMEEAASAYRKLTPP